MDGKILAIVGESAKIFPLQNFLPYGMLSFTHGEHYQYTSSMII